ncbi:hypothetical protein JX265_007561 [Neoarthrinium moseri]|uniref:Transcription factor Iwr1 domain-containing protein n=1 Tax=Neoarthrinium moseri TaxID=1658444 RepID=A0A9Q0AN27_9PEZI|nr:hypothetical protein JX266_000686 [Neoarthrinium moseri]KAI1866985.1 hypothetical protein JX265_007561 [Neoarthrinium moseri]
MSLPPQLIRVKRKATEDEPVSFLRVQEHKRHFTEAFVYQRQKQEAAFADIPSAQRPIIHTSAPLQDDTTFQSPRDKNTLEASKEGNGKDSAPPGNAAGAPISPTEQRRFHMSRADMMLATSNYPSQRNHGGVSKKRAAPALFVERKIKRLPSTTIRSVARGLNEHVSRDSSAEPPPSVQQSAQPGDMEVDMTDSKKLKKPGLAKEARGTDTPKKAELPASMTNRWNVDLDQLTADMNAFAMEQIGLNLQRAEEEKQRREKAARQPKYAVSQARQAPQSPSRFKPKAPAKRYAERHPGEAQVNQVDQETATPAVGASDTDDDEYIIETYVRVPVSTMEKQQVAPQSIGLLVFDEEPDLEFFYGENSDSEDEWAEEQEDENAENYYTADYPDEEVASDDEFGHNAYAYRTGNASDLEEYDVNGYLDSSPDEDSTDNDGFKSFVGRDGRVRRHL